MSKVITQQPHRRFDIALAGETNLDLILYGLPEDMPVERELLGTGFTTTLGGSSAILAHNLAILGSRTAFLSEVGDDAFGSIANDYLLPTGLDLSHFRRKLGTTTGVTVLLPHGRRRHILTYPGVMSELTVDDLDLGYLTSARHFHLSSLFLQTGLHAGLPRLFDTLRAAGLTLSLDTNDAPSGQWRGVLDLLLDKIDILLPNEDELLQIADADSLELALDKLAPRIPLIVVKCGPRGAVVQRDGNRDWVAPVSVQPIDTIGAGDSFNAGFLHAWLNGGDPLRAAAFGNITGALSTLRPGGIAAHADSGLRQKFLAEHL
ncbi:ribokinase [Granulicella sp. 5B5]|uniref:carbohydrate kinase family protein n=1 Tax=Granulicella sp. 5B5 TaxID=1617967 RepID=UPI0015F4218B|nr:carbohydrate kinase family protein [Granulicella sp. 5B5]QMV18350.1 ribokinase [Granulicella sp. 5B5]